MALSDEFSLILCCGGYTYNNLIICSGTNNIIIDFARHFEPLESKQIMDFLDDTCGLFDKPIGDWNKLINTLQVLYNKFHLINDELWKALYVWIPKHKQCGAVIKLMLNIEMAALIKSQEVLILPQTIKVW